MHTSVGKTFLGGGGGGQIGICWSYLTQEP